MNYKKRVSNKERHVRWNCESSGEEYLNLRYHFVIVDDRFREVKLNQLMESLNKINSGIMKEKRGEGKVEGTKLRYLFYSLNARTSLEYLDWNGLKPKRDKDLVERKKGNIEDYVANIYAKK
jgi:hypothetical protein